MAVAGRTLASVAEITILRAGVERSDELVGFWKLLHRQSGSGGALLRRRPSEPGVRRFDDRAQASPP